MKRIFLGLSAIGAASALTACSASTAQNATGADGSEPLTIYATTGYLADAALNLAPDAEVITMSARAVTHTRTSPPPKTSSKCRLQTSCCGMDCTLKRR